jgi:hypothetical protein
MIPALVVLQLVTLVVVIVLLLRRPAAAAEVADPRLAQLLAADLPTKFTQMDARAEGLNQHLRGELSQLRGSAGQHHDARWRGEVVARSFPGRSCTPGKRGPRGAASAAE